MPDTIPDDQVRSDFVGSRAQVAQSSSERELNTLLQAAPKQTQPTQPSTNAAVEQPLPLAHRIWNGVKAVGKDIAGGLAEAPKAIAGGLLDYGNNLMRFADDVVAYGEKHGLPNAYIRLLDKDGKWSPKIQSAEEFRKAKEEGRDDVFQVPTTGNPDTVTANIVRAGTTFLVGRGNVAGKGAGVAQNLLADFTSASTGGMNPNQSRLSNVIDSVAPNFVTGFLKAKPEDEGELISHLKSGMEMAGLGLAVQGVIKTVKAIKGAMTSTPEAAQAAKAAGIMEEPTPVQAEPVEVTASRMTPEQEAAFDAAEAQRAPEPKIGQPGTVAEQAEPGAATPFADMQDDLPWRTEPTPPGVSSAQQTEMAARAAAKDMGGLAGFPDRQAKIDLANQFLPLGKPEDPLVSFKPDVVKNAEAADAFLAQEKGTAPAPLEIADYMGGKGQNPIRVNLARIGGPDDLRDAIARVAKFMPERTKMTEGDMVWAADGTGLTPQQLLANHAAVGQSLGERVEDLWKQLLAARFIRDSGAEQLIGYAKGAADPAASPEAKAAYVKAFATQMAIQNEVAAGESAFGRGLRSVGILSQTRSNASEAIRQLIEAGGGEQSVDKLASRIAALDSPEEVARAVSSAAKMSPRDWMMYGYYNSLLSPRTVVKKLISDGLMATWNLATRWTAEKFGPENAIPAGETAELFSGYTGGFKDSVRAAWKALKAGESQFYREYQSMDALHYGRMAMLTENAPEQIGNEEAGKSAIQFLRSALPTSWIGAADDFATTANYLAEKRALAYRAVSNMGLEGEEAETQLAKLLQDPPDALHNQAVQAALKNTFKEPLTDLGASIKDTFDRINLPIGHSTDWEIPLGRMIVPFVRIPYNIAKWSYYNSPIPLLSRNSVVAQDLAAGGAARDLALARIGLGTGLSLSMISLAVTGKMTGRGPSSPELQRAWRAAGNEPFTMDLGFGKFGYNNLEPMGMSAAIIADTADIMRFSKEEDTATLAASLAFGLGDAMLSKSYLMGAGEFFQALEEPDARAAGWFRNFGTGAIPLSNTMGSITRATDDWQRSHYDFLSTVESKLPFVSQDLPFARTLWGDPIPLRDAFPGGGVARALSPIPVGGQGEVQPIDKWIWDHRMDFPRGADNKLGLSKPGMVQSFSAAPHVSVQVELTPEQLDRLIVLGGNELKDPSTGLGARDALNALVNGDHSQEALQRQWDNATDATRALMVQTVFNKYKAAAKKQLTSEFADLQDILNDGWRDRAQQLQPH